MSLRCASCFWNSEDDDDMMSSHRIVRAANTFLAFLVICGTVFLFATGGWPLTAPAYGPPFEPEHHQKPAAVLNKNTKPSDFILSTPHLAVDRPAEYGVPYVDTDVWLEHIKPKYSVLLNVYNSEAKLRIVLVQLLKMTTGPYELIISIDGSTDNSLEVVKKTWQRFGDGWPECPYTIDFVEPQRVWQSGQNLDSSQGDLGRECFLAKTNSLVHLRIIVIPKVGLFATASDNLKMKNSVGTYFILVDDDQIMTQYGWNVKLTWPLEKWEDVFSVSARCAHGFLDGKEGGPYAGPKCRNSLNLQGTSKEDRCFFFIRSSGNRGPLALRFAMVRQIGYMDEINHLGVITQFCDHEFNSRAYARFGWVSGFVAVDYTEERNFRSPTNAEHDKQVNRYVEWWRKRQANSSPVIYATPFAHLQLEHDEDRAIHDPSFDARCAVI